MRKENFRIGQLIKLKNNIDSGVKLDSQKVSVEIEQITRKLWADIDLGNINEQDLAEISSFHEFLLNENIRIADTEFIRNNNEVLEGIIDLRDLPADFTATALYGNAGKNDAFNNYK